MTFPQIFNPFRYHKYAPFLPMIVFLSKRYCFIKMTVQIDIGNKFLYNLKKGGAIYDYL